MRFVATADQRLAFGLSYFDKDIQTTTNLDSANTFSVDTARAGFVVRFQQFIVYNETNGTPGFQEGGDAIIRAVDFDDIARLGQAAAGWTFTVNAGVRDIGNNDNVRFVTVKSTNGIFAMRAFAGDRPFRVDGNRVRPDDVKISFAVNTSAIPNFDQTSYKIAIRAVIISATTRKQVDNTDGTAEVDAGGDAVASVKFNWAKTVNVTANAQRVSASVVTDIVASYANSTILAGFSSSFTATRLTWSLATDANIVGKRLEWDPAAAATVDYTALDGAASAAPATVVSFVFAILFAAVSLLLL